ncbi:hypothetical protein [Streptomyces atroolivaceus]|uniref:hypothetical protein n=1 Tax=Streptomyces atroolivaceus TaxID=66869 RepID=UPI0020254FBD|nr:hypothetical protein [Streptomyces atroolivaceus]
MPAAAFRWARHTGLTLAPAPGAPSARWTRAAVEALDADATRAAMPTPPIVDSAAADRITDALSTRIRPRTASGRT